MSLTSQAFSLTFLAELGDKTMLATIALACTDQGWPAVWLGSTMRLVSADGLAIAARVALGSPPGPVSPTGREHLGVTGVAFLVMPLQRSRAESCAHPDCYVRSRAPS